MPKTFKTNPTELFLSAPAAHEPQQAEPAAAAAAQPATAAAIPQGYTLTRESKTKRLQLLIRPTTDTALQRIAAERGTSKNDLINQALEEFIKGAG